MSMRRCGLFVLVVAALWVPTTAWAMEDAAQVFAAGQARLAQGDLDGAMNAFKEAVRIAPESQEYFQAYAQLRRVLRIREQFASESDEATWEKLGAALYQYYYDNELFREAFDVAQRMQAKLGNVDCVTRLACVQLLLNKDADAAALLGRLTDEQHTLRTQVLRGIALARTGKLDEAKALTAKLELSGDCDGAVCFDAARLYARVGQSEKALTMLACAFECASANQIESLKKAAKASPDLAPVKDSPAFAKALETQPKAAACGTSCGSSSGCGGCSSKTSDGCDKEKEKADGQKKTEGCEDHKK